MALVLSTQAKYSSLFPLRNSSENLRRDDELRDDVGSLGKAVRWRMSTESSPQVNLIQRRSLHRGPSMSQGRYRRRGWRASGTFGEQAGPGSEAVTRQNSGLLQPPEQLWGRPRLDEEDEDDSSTPGQSYVYPREGDPSYANSSAGSTLTSGTVRGEILASYGESQRAPHAEFGRRRPMRSESSGSSEANPARR